MSLLRGRVNKAKGEDGQKLYPRPYRRKQGSLYNGLVTHQTKGDAIMFDSLTSKVVTAICAVLGTFFVTLTGGSAYLEFGLAVIFFAMFIVGSYWWMVFGPGRGM